MRMTMRGGILLGLFGLLAASSALPGTIRTLHITRENGRYHLVADTHLDAPPEAIFKVLIDYGDDRFGRISEIYKESDYLPPDGDGTPLVYTRVEGCLLLFCRSMRRVERLEVVEPRFIRTTTLPERSDFKYSRSEWVLEPEEGGTHVTYRLEMEPDFWLPPFVGPWFLRRTLLRGGAAAVDRIEELAVAESLHASDLEAQSHWN
jgi:Polyketide cyclase / dehydrase and lipid transport